MKYLKTYESYESYSENPNIEIFKNQLGPVLLIDAKPAQSSGRDNGYLLETSAGDFFMNSFTYADMKCGDGVLLNPRPGYTYVFEIDKDSITNVALATCDLVILYEDIDKLELLSIKRKNNPFKGHWANPGGFIDEGEQPIDAAVRELYEETGVSLASNELKFVGIFDKENRDPRMKICVTYAFVCVLTNKPEAKAQDDADDCTWLKIDNSGDFRILDENDNVVDMAFDHYDVVKTAVQSIL